MYDIQLSNQDDVVVDRDSQSKTCKRLYKGNKDALGWALDGIARMVIFASAAVFLSTSLINLAKRSVGCSTEIPEGSNKVPECNEKIYGLRPSSILTVYGTILGLVVAVSLPFVGALLDHTHHRKAVGQISALVQVILVLSLCFLNENNFFIMMIVQVISQLAGWVHTLVM
jgi:MFS-type transporter involved in bile tolerance (Atg22 family)